MKDTQSRLPEYLHELFLDELRDLLDAENRLMKALPMMAMAANSPELVDAFQAHLEETKRHAVRLEEVFHALGEIAERKRCKAMKGLLAEAEDLMNEQEDNPALDAALIAAAQKVEHYEIASYGTVCEWAGQLAFAEAAKLLHETLEEEKTADAKLTGIARGLANQEQATEQRKAA